MENTKSIIDVKKPDECSAAELGDFEAFVLAGGEVEANGLEDRIKHAEKLLFLRIDGCLKGIAAIKNPTNNYKTNVFKKAKAILEPNQFQYELGWIYILPSARGNGFSNELVEKAISIIPKKAIFSTSREDNQKMHKVLKKYGFSNHGKRYKSNRGAQRLMLFVQEMKNNLDA